MKKQNNRKLNLRKNAKSGKMLSTKQKKTKIVSKSKKLSKK